MTAGSDKIAPDSAPDAWKRGLVSESATLADVIRNLEESSLQIALVVTSDGMLIGTLTDGDVRRGLLRGLDLASPIESIVIRSPLVVPPQLGRDMVLQLMQANKIGRAHV